MARSASKPAPPASEGGKGSGQGLAIARAVVVEHHCGEILVETEPGSGTTLILRLPRGSEDGDASADA